MIDSFSDIISKMKYHLAHKEEGYKIPLAPKFNSVVGNILPGQYTVITGMQSSGKTSFVDQNYVLSVLLQWSKLEEKPPLKILYFSLKDTTIKKFQSLLCAYIKIVHNIRVDIPTLNSQPGRLYDIENEPLVLAAIDDAEIFFNEIIANGVLRIITTVNKPSAIHATINEEIAKQPEHHKNDLGLLMVVVDSTEYLGSESDGFHNLRGADLDYRFDSLITPLVKDNSVHAVIVTPAHSANSRFPKENEPNYRQLGIYSANCDKGIVLYNPIAESNTNYLRSISDPTIYINAQGLNTLRFWHVVRNADGIDSVQDRLLFLPGTSYMIEVTSTDNVEDFNSVKNFLFNVGLNPFYKAPQTSTTDAEA